ncbi:MAG: hypothetical protein M1814_003215 [Vezdaea aestivalis]|nr:MAG: hypothetical protein M1814_003215 [Vezdaea aestivalis]
MYLSYSMGLKAHFYVGDPVNRPNCGGVLDAHIKEYAYIIDNSKEYTSTTELCAHRFYGGHNQSNAGGVCLWRQKDSGPHLEFPYKMKSPNFTTDFFPIGTVDRASFPRAIELYCRSICSCTEIDQNVADATKVSSPVSVDNKPPSRIPEHLSSSEAPNRDRRKSFSKKILQKLLVETNAFEPVIVEVGATAAHFRSGTATTTSQKLSRLFALQSL